MLRIVDDLLIFYVQQINDGYSEYVPMTLNMMAGYIKDDVPLPTEAKKYLVACFTNAKAGKPLDEVFLANKRKKMSIVANQVTMAEHVHAMRLSGETVEQSCIKVAQSGFGSVEKVRGRLLQIQRYYRSTR